MHHKYVLLNIINDSVNFALAIHVYPILFINGEIPVCQSLSVWVLIHSLHTQKRVFSYYHKRNIGIYKDVTQTYQCQGEEAEQECHHNITSMPGGYLATSNPRLMRRLFVIISFYCLLILAMNMMNSDWAGGMFPRRGRDGTCWYRLLPHSW